MPHRVLLNDRTLYQASAGVAVTLRMLLEHWPDEPQCDLTGVLTHTMLRRKYWPKNRHHPAASAPDFSPVRLTLKPLNTLKPPRRLPSIARRYAQSLYRYVHRSTARPKRYDAAWEPNHLASPTKLPTLTTMHDLSLFEHPAWHPPDRVKQWEQDLSSSIHATSRWVTGSVFTQERMITLLGIRRDLIDVVPLAPRPLPTPDPSSLPRLLNQCGLPPRYILVLGTIEPRKNFGVLLDALASLDPIGRINHRVIIAGAPGWGDNAFWQSLINHPMADEVMTTGRLDDTQIALLLKGATALFMPSHYEGFGLPLIEAMAAGVPTVASDIPAFREVTRGASLLLPPDDPSAWAAAIESTRTNPERLTSLAEHGVLRASELTWTAAAARYDTLLARLVQETWRV